MDTSEGYEGLDFGLGEPGLVEDTRIEDANRLAHDPHGDALTAELSRFDSVRTREKPAVGCYLRVRMSGGTEVQTQVAQARVLERLRGAVRASDLCLAMAGGEVAMALADCDVEAARKRAGLLAKLVEMDPVVAATSPAVWTGIAPIAIDAVQGMRTARLACELAMFQPAGHVEVIDL